MTSVSVVMAVVVTDVEEEVVGSVLKPSLEMVLRNANLVLVLIFL